ncbi:hypothetical protein FRC19_007031 [Serendipita sp. 401]|nr:hypothetical protein FRC19_007031 [Serendipita sp. 401]
MFVGHFFSPLPLYQQRKISPEAEQRRVEELMNRPSISPSLADERDFPSHVVLYTAEHDSFAKKMDSLRTKLKEDETINVFGRMVPRVGHGWDLIVQRDQAGYEEWNEACNVCAGIIFRK